jgi:threonine synthase
MAGFRATGRMDVPQTVWRHATELFRGFKLDDSGTLAEIRATHDATGYLADPHTAIALAAARADRCQHVPTIVAATAHPAKFPDAMARATGMRPPLPRHLETLYDREERFSAVPADLGAIEDRLRAFTARNTT